MQTHAQIHSLKSKRTDLIIFTHLQIKKSFFFHNVLPIKMDVEKFMSTLTITIITTTQSLWKFHCYPSTQLNYHYKEWISKEATKNVKKEKEEEEEIYFTP